jgi:hypothetical protein
MSKLSFILTFIIILTILFETSSVVGAPSDTMVSINPKFQTVYPGENFTVDVYCVPGRPIKAFELKLSFNPTRLKAIDVTQGNIFNNYSTFFNEGVINNQVGTITSIYGLILGEGTVIDPGTFVTISFTSKEKLGSYTLDISNVGITNEIGYVSIDVSDGTVSVRTTNNVPPPPPGGPFDDGNEENNPPMIPLKPSGPTYVGLGVEYTYSTTTYDIDGDQVRYRFDWGDGNISDWSNYIASNKTVSMSHTFSFTSVFEVRVMAQDLYGLNSSWSLPIDVTISQAISGDKPPVANFSIFGNLSANNTIIFDGIGSFDEDGVIVLYYWDFGDGTNGSGVNISHIFHKPGGYPVTLIVTDNNGYTYSKTILITINPEIKEEKLRENQIVLPFDFSIIFIIFTIVMFICLTFLLRDNIKSFASSFSQLIRMFSLRKIWNNSNLVKKRDKSVEKIRNTRMRLIDLKQLPILKPDKQSYKNYYFKDKVYTPEGKKIPLDRFYTRPSDSSSFMDIESQIDNIIFRDKVDKPEGKKIPIDGFYTKTSDSSSFMDIESQIDNIIFRDKVDKPEGKKIPIDGFYTKTSDSSSFKDIGSQIDNVILSNEIQHLEKFNIKNERILSELESNDIERKVDELIKSKMQ